MDSSVSAWSDLFINRKMLFEQRMAWFLIGLIGVTLAS
jgi:hypothetical protein